MPIKRVLIAAVLAAMLVSTAAARKAAPSPSDLVAAAQAQVEQGTVDPARDLQPLLDGLATARDDGAKQKFVDAIEEIGAADGTSPAAVKAWLLEHSPPLLLDVARSQAGWSLRGDALMALRALDAPDAVMDEAIAIARADTSESKSYIRSRGALLEDWKDNRKRGGGTSTATRPADTQAEQRALELLRSRSVGVSSDSLTDAIGKSRADVVEALLDAGVDVNGPGRAGMRAFDSGLMVACANNNHPTLQLETLDVLFKRGVNLGAKDERGNTVLMTAVQSCPLAVVEKLVAGGAEVDPVNAQQFTPLKLALVSGHWDIADFLAGKGARITSREADQLFFEKPQDPAQLAVLKRAIRPGK